MTKGTSECGSIDFILTVMTTNQKRLRVKVRQFSNNCASGLTISFLQYFSNSQLLLVQIEKDNKLDWSILNA